MLAENDGTLPGMARSEPPELRESIKNNDDNMAPPTKEMLSEFRFINTPELFFEARFFSVTVE